MEHQQQQAVEESVDMMCEDEDHGAEQENIEDDVLLDDQPLFLNPEDVVEVHVDDDNVPMDDDDDDDDDVEDDFENEENESVVIQQQQEQRRKDVVDMSNLTLSSHAGHVYAVDSFYDDTSYEYESNSNSRRPYPTAPQLFVVSGGGDDKAFLHQIVVIPDKIRLPSTTATTTTEGPSAATQHPSNNNNNNNNNTTTISLDYAHKDSVSCVALNLPHLPSTSTCSADDTKKFPRILAVGSYDGAIVLYNPDTGAQLSQATTGDSSTLQKSVLEGPTDVECLAWHPKGGSVLLAGSAADGTLWMYHVPMRKCLQVFVGHESAVTACRFSPDGKWALSASSDGTVRLWAPRTGLCKHVFRFNTSTTNTNSDTGGGGGNNNTNNSPPGLTCMAINGGSDGQLIIVGAEDGQAHVCHVGSKKIVASLRHYEVPAAKTAATTSKEQDDDDDDDEQEEGENLLPMSVEAVAFASPTVNPNWCATGGVDGVLKIWDLANNAQCRQICQQPSTTTVAAAQTNAEGGGGGGEATAAKAKDNDNKPGGITRLQWHPSLPVVFTADTVGVIRIWDARNGKLLQSLTGHTDVINDMNISFVKSKATAAAPEDAVIVSASDDKTVRLFHVDVTALMQQQMTSPA